MFRDRARRDCCCCVANISVMFRSFVLEPSTLPLRLVALNLPSKSITVYTTDVVVTWVHGFGKRVVLVLSNHGLRRCALALVAMLLTPLALSQLL